MTKEDVVKLFRKARKEPALKGQLNRASTPESFVQMAQELGYYFTVEEWQEVTGFQVDEFNCDLSEIPGL